MNGLLPEVLKQHLIDPEICIRCNTCEETCPVDAITHDSRNYVVMADKCNACMACVPPCPTECIQLGEKYSLPGHTRDEMVVHFHQGGYPIQMKTPEAAKQVEEFKSGGVYDKKKKEREAVGIPTLRPQS